MQETAVATRIGQEDSPRSQPRNEVFVYSELRLGLTLSIPPQLDRQADGKHRAYETQIDTRAPGKPAAYSL